MSYERDLTEFYKDIRIEARRMFGMARQLRAEFKVLDVTLKADREADLKDWRLGYVRGAANTYRSNANMLLLQIRWLNRPRLGLTATFEVVPV